MALNSKVQTLEDLINYGKTSVYSQPQISILFKEDNMIFLDSFAYAKYDKLLMNNAQIFELNDEQMARFKYRPDMLAEALYGNPNLSHLILYLNNCAEYEFNRKIVTLLAPGDIDDVFQEIIVHEQDNIKKSLINTMG